MGRELSDADLSRLNQLASMRDKGILTDAEFAEQKRRLVADAEVNESPTEQSRHQSSRGLKIALGVTLLVAVLLAATLLSGDPSHFTTERIEADGSSTLVTVDGETGAIIWASNPTNPQAEKDALGSNYYEDHLGRTESKQAPNSSAASTELNASAAEPANLEVAKLGDDYHAARRALIAAGFQPAPIPAEMKTGTTCEAFRWCKKYPEMIDCSGTGVNECRFAFIAPDDSIVVGRTVGELEPALEAIGWANAYDAKRVRNLIKGRPELHRLGED